MANQPTYRAYNVSGDDKDSIWTDVGAAFPHKDGKGFNLVIKDGLSVSGRVVLREPSEKTEEDKA